MRLLLDTHALLWWWLDDARLSRRARSLLEGENTDFFVSAASALEIAIKVRVGKLPEARRLIEDFDAGLALQGMQHLPVTVAHGRRAGLLAGRHRDPFDRILAAQSLIEDLAILSNDKLLGTFGARMVW